jgi:hypothetical protein
MLTVISVETTPAVREFQKIYSLCSNRISEASQRETRAFWTNQLAITLHEICKKYDVTGDSLVSEWEDWVRSVEDARAKVGA